MIATDSTLKLFKFFGKLIGAVTNCFVTTSRVNEVGLEVAHVAAEQQCEMVIVPWNEQDKRSDCFFYYLRLFQR